MGRTTGSTGELAERRAALLHEFAVLGVTGDPEVDGGASGGPWVQPMDLERGTGPVVSVNSWGYTDRPGMAGPLLSGSAAALLAAAESATPTAGGVAV